MRKPNYTPESAAKLVDAIRAQFGDVVTRQDVADYVESNSLPAAHFIFKDYPQMARGRYNIGGTATANVVPMPKHTTVTHSLVPDVHECFVPFGFCKDLTKIIKSKKFYPVYITGLSGNGKTFMIQQICASLGRECIRVNITKRTDETDLIGNYELVDGNTVRREGPVITAMRRGAVLILDETDYGTEDILCLNGVLEGNPYFDKKSGEMVYPAEGFNIIATANTKGKGSDDGRFIGANVLNEAFLERFAITFDHNYPERDVEVQILTKTFASEGVVEVDEYIDKLVTWANVIRKSFDDSAVDEVISTRRLCHIAGAYSMFNNRKKAVELCLNRFDEETKVSFLDLYTKIDANATVEEVQQEI
jgi:nicotinamide riboside kinase